MSLEPDVLQMLQIGKNVDLNTAVEAFDYYMSHYDMFFLIDKFQEQYQEFSDKLKSLGFVEEINGKLYIKDMPINDAIKVVRNG